MTAEFILEELNGKAKFDFNYIPEEGDQLIVSICYKYVQIKNNDRPFLPRSMTFVYENKEWYFGYIDHFEYEQEKIKEWKLSIQNINEQ